MNRKSLLEDMVRVKREGLQKEDAKVVRLREIEPKIKKYPKKEIEEDFQVNEYSTKEDTSSSSKYRLWIVALLCLVGLFFAVSVLFWKAHIVVHPKVESFSINTKLLAAKDSNTSDLPFELVVISGEERGQVKAEGVKEYNDVAEGTVVLYNMYSTTPQKIAKDTRLEGSNGKIYKTKEETVIPTITPDGFPGTVEVGIYATEAGEEYNSPPLDFKILGFKGTPKYESFYGRSKNEIQGGLKGTFSSIPEISKVATFGSLETALKAKLFKKVTDQIPEGYILYPGAVSFRTEEEKTIPSNAEEAEVYVAGTLSGILFKEEDLTRKIAEATLPKYDGVPLYIQNIKNLKFTFGSGENLFWDSEKASFTLSGDIKFIWKVDSTSLVPLVLNKKKSEMESVLSKYPNISSIDLSIRPFWKKSIPPEAKNIEINVLYPQ